MAPRTLKSNGGGTEEAEKRIAAALSEGATALDLGGLGLTALPEALGRLTQLQRLNVSHNQLTALPEALGQLTKLQELDVSRNQLTSLPEALGQLAQLQELEALGNQLTSLPEALGRLAQLQRLYVPFNQLTALPEALGRLTLLQELDVRGNQLTALPEALGRLTLLQELDVSRNQLTSLTEALGSLTKLQELNVSRNQLTSLPEALGQLAQLQRLVLHGNPELAIPEELLGPMYHDLLVTEAGPDGTQAILEYYSRTREGRRPLNEAKLVLVGFGGVGKTSVVKRLIDDCFEPRERITDGIAISDWTMPVGDSEVEVHVWDFGGQEIMHATHQFFLTHRSLYLVVLNGREGREDADAEYWLNLTASFGGDSPVIVVLNKIREHPFEVNRTTLRQKFPMVRDVVATDCADPPEGRQKLLDAIRREIDALPGLRDAFPAAWFAIKERLSSMPENYLTFDRYRAVCAESGVTDHEDQNRLAEVLHRLGVALNYREDTRLYDLNVLNPRWVTEGVYKILNHPSVAERKGELGLRDVVGMLDPSSYPPERHSFLLELMRKFELCFRFPDEDDRYLIPQLLPKEQPGEADRFDPAACLCFEYHYPTLLPEGLLPRFIVRSYVLSSEEPRWRSGVILRFEGHRALVVGDPVERKVRVRISGAQAGRRRLLAVVRTDLDRIHAGYKFRPEAMIPVPGHPHVVVRYDDMVAFEAKGLREVPHVADGEVIMLPVKAMLDGVDMEGTRRAPDARQPLDVRLQAFVSYSHKDDRLRAELETHLKLLQRIGLLNLWTDRKIGAGNEWKGKIDENLERAGLILLLVSADFMNSDYCYDIEMQRALERHEAGEARVVPIIVRKVNWRAAPFARLQALPADGKVVDRGTGGPAARDALWTKVAEGLERALKEIAASRSRERAID
jgi:internalin A